MGSTGRGVAALMTTVLTALALAGCGSSVASLAPGLGATEESPSADAGYRKIGKPYKVGGRWYHPSEDEDYDQVGLASWYGPKFHGKRTANGERFDQNALTGAHKTLPLPSFVRVTNVTTGKAIVVRINDRGPFKHGRIVDLSKRAATELGFRRAGRAKVRVQYLGPAPIGGGDKETLLAAKEYGVTAAEVVVANVAQEQRVSKYRGESSTDEPAEVEVAEATPKVAPPNGDLPGVRLARQPDRPASSLARAEPAARPQGPPTRVIASTNPPGGSVSEPIGDDVIAVATPQPEPTSATAFKAPDEEDKNGAIDAVIALNSGEPVPAKPEAMAPAEPKAPLPAPSADRFGSAHDVFKSRGAAVFEPADAQ